MNKPVFGTFVSLSQWRWWTGTREVALPVSGKKPLMNLACVVHVLQDAGYQRPPTKSILRSFNINPEFADLHAGFIECTSIPSVVAYAFL